MKVNRDAIGARVTVTVNGRKLVREVKSSRGTYSSADSRALLFGLGGARTSACATIEIRWPSGEVRQMAPAETNKYLTINYERRSRGRSVRSYAERDGPQNLMAKKRVVVEFRDKGGRAVTLSHSRRRARRFLSRLAHTATAP